MGERNRVGIELSYRPARLHVHTTQPGGIGSLESILGLSKSLKIRGLSVSVWNSTLSTEGE
jgi:hypothetical protein